MGSFPSPGSRRNLLRGMAALLLGLAVMPLAARSFHGLDGTAAWTLRESNGAGMAGGIVPVAVPSRMTALLAAWDAFLDDPDAAGKLRPLLGLDGPDRLGHWYLLEASAPGHCRLSDAEVHEEAPGGRFLVPRESDDRHTANTVIGVLIPPKDHDRGARVQVAMRFPDGSVMTEQYRKGVLESRQEMDPAGHCLRELRWRGDLCIEVILHRWEDDLLMESRTWRIWGLFVVDRRRYSLSGALRESWQEYPGRGTDRLVRTGAPGAGGEEWHRLDDGDQRVVRDARGRVALREVWLKGVLDSRTEYDYQTPEDPQLLAVQTRWPGSDRRELATYDAEGRLSAREEFRNNRLRLRESFLYDEAGNPVSQTLMEDGKTREWTREWGSDGILVREAYAEEGKPVRETRYRGGNREEDIYVDGQLSLRTWWVQGQRTALEEYKDGAIVRKKTF